MTTIREAAQMALDALEMHSQHYESDDTFSSCPASESAWEGHKGECDCGADEANAAIAALRAALEQPEPEPVAWHYTNNAGVSVVHWGPSPSLDADLAAARQYPHAHKVTPLYAEQPQRKPLPEAKIEELMDLYDVTSIDFARAIEQAHGIGVDDGKQ